MNLPENRQMCVIISGDDEDEWKGSKLLQKVIYFNSFRVNNNYQEEIYNDMRRGNESQV